MIDSVDSDELIRDHIDTFARRASDTEDWPFSDLLENDTSLNQVLYWNERAAETILLFAMLLGDTSMVQHIVDETVKQVQSRVLKIVIDDVQVRQYCNEVASEALRSYRRDVPPLPSERVAREVLDARLEELAHAAARRAIILPVMSELDSIDPEQASMRRRPVRLVD